MHLRKKMFWGATLVCVAFLAASPALAAGPFVEPDAVALQTFSGEQVPDAFGWAAETIGDINRDRVNDFVTSAPSYADGGPNAGKVYVYSGRSGALLHAITGNTGEQFGWSVSRAFDANRDHTPDYVVGAPGPLDGTPFVGRAVVYSGADHSVIRELAGPAGAGFGSGVTGAGDVNHDGYPELIVGAAHAGFSFTRAGRVYLFSGKDGALLWTHDGHSANGRLGSAVGLVGDVDDDRVADLAAGAPGVNSGAGEVYVLSGATGQVIYTLSPIDSAGGGSFGYFFAAGAGDVNRDRIPDIFVGDWNATVSGAPGTGRAYVFSGKDGARLHVFEAEQPGDGFGVGRAIGDVDGDKYDDLIIAAYTSSAGASAGGKAYLYSGRDGAVMRTITGTVPNDNLGVDALAIGDVDGDRLTDYILTSVGNSFIQADVGRVYIVAGTR
jgi:hypothetical protein